MRYGYRYMTKFKRSCGFDEAVGLQQLVSKLISSWVTNNSLILGQNSSINLSVHNVRLQSCYGNNLYMYVSVSTWSKSFKILWIKMSVTLKYDFLNLAGRMQAKIIALATKWLLTQVSQQCVQI